jgi:hypothetical protein
VSCPVESYGVILLDLQILDTANYPRNHYELHSRIWVELELNFSFMKGDDSILLTRSCYIRTSASDLLHLETHLKINSKGNSTTVVNFAELVVVKFSWGLVARQ